MLMACFSTCSAQSNEIIEDDPKEEEVTSLRLISYNILEGMKLDRDNNYDNFVAWLNEYKPDILALQEANKFTQASLEELAARYGHNYVVTNIKTTDNYPVALTSKYPVEVRRRLTKDMSHGAIYATIKGINIVVLHLWPQSYWHVSSPNDGLGNAYRMQEINIVLDSTVHKYKEEKDWLMMGDFNSFSPVDSGMLSNSATRYYEIHRTIMQAGYSDAQRYYMDEFQRTTPTVYSGWTGETSTNHGSRIDFIYGTPTMLRKIKQTKVIYDKFTDNYSDHYPVMTDFKLK